MAIKEFCLSWGMLVLSIVFNAYGVFVIKLKMNELGPLKPESLKSVVGYTLQLLNSRLVLGGVILFFAAPFLFAIALSRMQISVAYPAQTVLNLLLLILVAALFLGEAITLHKVIAIGFALLSIYFLYRK